MCYRSLYGRPIPDRMEIVQILYRGISPPGVFNLSSNDHSCIQGIPSCLVLSGSNTAVSSHHVPLDGKHDCGSERAVCDISARSAIMCVFLQAHLHLHDTDDQGGQREECDTSVVSVPFTPLLLQARQPRLALEAFTGLQCSNFRPNVVTWTTIISGLSKHSKRGMPYAQQAYQLWKQLEASGEQTGNAAAHAAGKKLQISPSA
jgi:hypothetical protein